MLVLSLLTVIGSAVPTSSAADAHHHGTPGGSSPEPYVEAAMAAHPTVEAAHHRAEAMRSRISPAGALADPIFTVGIQNLPYDPLSFTATPMTGIRVGLAQSFPWPTKLSLAEEMASFRSKAAAAGTEEQRNRLAAMVREVFYDIHFADVAIDVIATNLKIIDGFVEITDAKYRVGRGLQQDSLKARVVRGQLEERLIGLRRQREALAVRLNSLMARPASTRVPKLLEVAVTDLPKLDATSLLSKAETTRPLLVRLQREITAAERQKALAETAAFPDFTVAIGYTFRLVEPDKDPIDGADFLSLSAGITLPVWYGSKQGPLSRAAREEASAAKQDLEAARLEVSQTVESALAQIPDLLKQMELFRSSIIPTTRQTLDADRIAYQVDKVDFLNLLDIEMRLLNFEVDYHRLHVQREKLIVQMAEAVGVAPADLGKLE